MALSEDDLSRIEALCNAASPGPWRSFIEGRDHTSGDGFIQTSNNDLYLIGATTADQDFIASARQDVPLLIDEVRRLQALMHGRP
jgi:hypothetical protein